MRRAVHEDGERQNLRPISLGNVQR
uniref:Uncharacterized protein n=1 Tax=Arundo donax TaxID=35708 RepID=A0A0A9BMR7_ARUDO